MAVDRKQFILISNDLGLNVSGWPCGGGAVHTEPQTTKLKFWWNISLIYTAPSTHATSRGLATVFSRIFTVIKAPITVNFNASFETWILLWLDLIHLNLKLAKNQREVWNISCRLWSMRNLHKVCLFANICFASWQSAASLCPRAHFSLLSATMLVEKLDIGTLPGNVNAPFACSNYKPFSWW